MRVLTAALLIVVFGLPVVFAQQAKGTIEGIVVSATSGNPVVAARVTVSAGSGDARPSLLDQLMSVLANAVPDDLGPRPVGMGPSPGRGPSMPSITTEADGKFSFELDPGIYRITADANGYVPAELGQRATIGMGAPIYLEPGQTVNALTLRMTPTGVLTGRLVDGAGRPAVQVPVQVLRVTYTTFGQRVMDVGGAAMTNDRGEYRLYGLTPGRYYLNAGSMVVADAAALAAGRAFFEGIDDGQAIPRPEALTEIYLLTYYPGASDMDRAVPIDVRAGEESRADMTVTRGARHFVRGRVIDSRTGKPPAAGSVSLTYHMRTGGTSGSSVRINPDSGAFSFQGVIPADYTLKAQAPVVSPPGRTSGTAADTMAAQVAAGMAAPTVTMPINVSGDLENVVLTISPPAAVNGRVTVTGDPLSTLSDFDRIRPGLRQFINGGVNPIGASAQVSSDGTFHLDVPEDEYKFGITGIPPGFYVEKADMGGADLLSDPMKISRSVSGILNVVLRRGTGTLSGTVTDAQSRGVAGVQVVLVPEQRRRLDLYKTVITDKSGRYALKEIPPGSYRVFSWEAIAPYSFYDSDVLSLYERRGQPARIVESSNTMVDVTIIPVEP